MSKIKEYAEIKKIVDTAKKQSKKVVFTNGCFDIIHIGHTRYLNKAKLLGDILIVGLNTDLSVKINKSDKKPIVPEEQRAEVLESIEYVDYVFLFNEKSPVIQIKELQPDTYCKGGDYTLDNLNQEERLAVESYGGDIKIINVDADTSTTKIMNKILSLVDFK